MFNLFILFLVIVILNGEKIDTQEKNRLVGLDTVHGIKIDKDTIITRNMKLEKRNRQTGTTKKDVEQEPNWSYSTFPQEVFPHVDQFKKNMSECLKEVQAKEKNTVKRLSPKTESPVHGECLIACVLKRNGVISNGKVHKDNLISLVSKFFARDTKLLKKLDKNLDRCVEVSSKIKDECAMASKLNDCTNDLMSGNKHKILVNY
ncbi:uncharacterized protein [Battus philenor]|uniref:uncharacterized protein n=1 Tax=Battus philenor TaxID=42288 RepID=UPI0035CEBBDD